MSTTCQTTASYKDQFGSEHYHQCAHRVYCSAKYKDALKGEIIERHFCKKHFNALVKNIARIERKTTFKCELTYCEV